MVSLYVMLGASIANLSPGEELVKTWRMAAKSQHPYLILLFSQEIKDPLSYSTLKLCFVDYIPSYHLAIWSCCFFLNVS